MKMKSKMILVLAALLVSSSTAFAASDVKGTVSNKADVAGTTNVAMGIANEARVGSVGIEDSKVKGTVSNQANIKGSTNVAMALPTRPTWARLT